MIDRVKKFFESAKSQKCFTSLETFASRHVDGLIRPAFVADGRSMKAIASCQPTLPAFVAEDGWSLKKFLAKRGGGK